MLDYAFVVTAVVLFSVQFFFHQQYERRGGGGLFAVLVFGAVTGAFGFLAMFAIGGLRMPVVPFSFWLALWRAVNSAVYGFAALKALGRVNLSAFTLFAMLGGMVLPLLVGVIGYGETLSPFGWAGCALVLAALACTVRRGEGKKGSFFFYAAVFVSNGMSGVIAKIHQSAGAEHVESAPFLALSSLLYFGICLFGAAAVAFLRRKETDRASFRAPLSPFSLLFAGGYGVINGVANFLLLLSLVNLPAAVQYPLVTGGVMVGGTVISLLRREKVRRAELLATLLALASTVLLAF